MVLIIVLNIYICFEIYGIEFYEGEQERNNQVVLMIINMEHSSWENNNNSSKYNPSLKSLIH